MEGSLPLLPAGPDVRLSQWVVGRQQIGHERQGVVHKARAMTEMIFDWGVDDGWYKRFMERLHGGRVNILQWFAIVSSRLT
ncbi:Hypothetical protein PHPALM_9457 [Phytophthora palmivora]|uniref:HTH CENPB-type domain-containing protein n=1 Tax=Phytophthora palmivora TaxID=4796 RepID=A0A2P4Y7L7_9STRA|nr:Hypothetical protein PHPALM_9457 [Phytophthora palmivora]